MRVANGGGRLCLVKDGRLVDVANASAGEFSPDPDAAFDRWQDLLMWASQLAPDVGGRSFDNVQLGTPVTRPSQVFAAGLNYREHAAEAGAEIPKRPSIFTKFPSCLTGQSAKVHLPSDFVDWEVELVAVIGGGGRHIPATTAWDHVAGLTIGQDLSERKVQLEPPLPQFSLGKSYAGFGPLGPVLVSPDEFDDPDDLALGCSVNGEIVQEARTSAMIFGIPALVEAISAIVELRSGDVIFSGTPSGVGFARDPARYLAPGDVLESWVEGIGTLRTLLTARDPSDNGRTQDGPKALATSEPIS
jgi:2,4-diketo-3-deoxy-L-fuconate hydrolase